MKVDSSLI